MYEISRSDVAYVAKFEELIGVAMKDDRIWCPWKDGTNFCKHVVLKVREHFICREFQPRYTN